MRIKMILAKPRCPRSGKVIFETKGAAEARLEELRGKSTLRFAYRCDSCKRWHLTSGQNRLKRVKQREQLYDGGATPPRRVSIEPDTKERQKKMEDLWAESLGIEKPHHGGKPK